MQTWSQKVICGSMIIGLMIIPNLHLSAAESATTVNPLTGETALPFSIKVTEESFPDQDRPDYMSPKNPSPGMDFPFTPVVIDGEFWVFSKNGYQKPVYRYKGTTIENAVRQPDGTAPELKTGMYILGGAWYDAADKKVYAPLHTEIHGLVHPILREIHLASSTDKGLTWKYEGPIITDNLPDQPRKGPNKFKGKLHSGGDGDQLIYEDKRNGFVYIFTDNYVWGGAKFLRHCVARCAIADKMAPGKWRKFYDGAWNEPALGGKASYVNGYCVTYNAYLKKYLSFNYLSGISMCSDLAKQDWSASYALGGKYWGVQGLYGMWPTSAEKNDISSSEKLFSFLDPGTRRGSGFELISVRGKQNRYLDSPPPRYGFIPRIRRMPSSLWILDLCTTLNRMWNPMIRSNRDTSNE